MIKKIILYLLVFLLVNILLEGIGVELNIVYTFVAFKFGLLTSFFIKKDTE